MGEAGEERERETWAEEQERTTTLSQPNNKENIDHWSKYSRLLFKPFGFFEIDKEGNSSLRPSLVSECIFIRLHAQIL